MKLKTLVILLFFAVLIIGFSGCVELPADGDDGQGNGVTPPALPDGDGSATNGTNGSDGSGLTPPALPT